MAGLVPELPAFPLAELIPAPADVVRSVYTVVERALEEQRRIVEGLADAVAPVTHRLMPWTRGRRSERRGDQKSTSRTSAEAA